jgi:hypothetical protein
MKAIRSPSRRRLLQGLTGAALAYPFVRALPSSLAAEHPLRVLFFYSPNNSVDEPYWRPDGEGTEFALPAELPAMLTPLNDFRDNLLIVGNMVMDTRDKETGSGGHVGNGHQLTGWANSVWPNQANENEYWGGGISLDQHIANELGCNALTLASRPYGDSCGGTRISYTGKDLVVDPYQDPAQAWNAVFGAGDLEPDELLAANGRQVKSLKHVALEMERLRKKMPQEDRQKLEAHLQHLEKIQSDLESFKAAECNAQPPDGDYDYDSGSDYPITSRRHMDVLASAIACGVTRVGSIQNGNTGNAENYSGGMSWPSEGLSYNRSQHVIAHDFETDPDVPDNAGPRLEIETFYIRQYAYLLQKLRDIPEGDGSVLDNTLVVWTKGMGRGHSKDRLLYLLAGGSGFKDVDWGRYVDRKDVPHNNMLVTIANLVGLDTTTFGDPELCSGAVAL